MPVAQDGLSPELGDNIGERRVNMATIGEVIAEQASSLMDTPGVTVVGQTEVGGKECILVMLTHSSPEIEARIPSTLGGYTVVTEVSGVIQAQRKPCTPPSG